MNDYALFEVMPAPATVSPEPTVWDQIDWQDGPTEPGGWDAIDARLLGAVAAKEMV